VCAVGWDIERKDWSNWERAVAGDRSMGAEAVEGH